jgi:hypothetical protein
VGVSQAAEQTDQALSQTLIAVDELCRLATDLRVGLALLLLTPGRGQQTGTASSVACVYCVGSPGGSPLRNEFAAA